VKAGRAVLGFALVALCAGVIASVAPVTAATTPTDTRGWPALPPFDTTMSWSDCGGGWECGTLTVPVDWNDPTNDTVGLAVTRHHAEAPESRVGALFFNPGGPGFGGTGYIHAAIRRLPAVVRARFDLVSWDPRGTGDSRPIDCVDDAFLDTNAAVPPVPDSAETLAAARSYQRALARGCVERAGAYAGQVGTRNSARDLEALRIALGEPSLNYVGFSYGSILGLVYAQMFPTSVRSMVLDGPPNYWLSTLDYAYAQARAFKDALEEFLGWCEEDTSCALRDAGSPRDVFSQLLDRYNRGAVPADYTSNGVTRSGSLTANLFETAVLSMLYDKSRGWPILARSLLAAARGDSGPLLSLADGYLRRQPDGTWSSAVEANAVINCVDRPDAKPRSAARELADVARFQSDLPPWGGGWAVSSCAGMPKPARYDALGDVRVTNAPPILVVGTTGDPATPYAGANAVLGRISAGALLTFESTEHTGYGTQRSTCIDDHVDEYLVDRVVPAPGTRCSPGVSP
jgi:pimeloyl-ACP methyl ester carboxylesterase